jgi:hypothetical protein
LILLKRAAGAADKLAIPQPILGHRLLALSTRHQEILPSPSENKKGRPKAAFL